MRMNIIISYFFLLHSSVSLDLETVFFFLKVVLIGILIHFSCARY